MFHSMGIIGFLKVVLYANAAVAVMLASDRFELLPALPLVSLVSIPVIVVSVVIFVVDRGPIFRWLCGLPLVWRLFPNIDAEYTIKVSSNWPIIEARRAGREPDFSPEGDPALLKRVGKAKISARLTRVEMTLTMDDNYLTSETVTCSVQRYRGERKPELFYIYDSEVSTPKSTDSQRHLGAARLSIPLERCPKVLEGNYWTDRNWHHGLNTSGHISLTRI